MKEQSLTELQINGQVIKSESLQSLTTNSTSHLSTCIKTSYGPLGLDKIIINSLGDIITTNDGSTILNSLQNLDPIQKLMTNISSQIDKEIGDGTTTVVLLASSLIKYGNELKKSVHQSVIVNGYKLAYKELINFFKNIQIKGDNEIFKNVLKTALSSKILNVESDFFAGLLYKNFDKKMKFLKAFGEGMKDSECLDGYALNCRAETGSPKNIKNAKILCIDFDLQKIRMPLNVNIKLTNVEEVENIKKMEERIILERVGKIIKSGVNVVLSTKGIDDLCSKKLVQSGIMAVKRVKDEDLQEIASILNVSVLRTLSDMDGNDQVGNIGYSDLVSVKEYDEKDVIFIKNKLFSTIVLRGSNEQMLDEMERSMHDAICVLKRIKESKDILPGGGAVECASYLYLKEFIETISSKEYVAISKFGDAMLDLIKNIISNAGLGDEILADLLRQQSSGNSKGDKKCFELGLDVVKGVVQNNVKMGIVEPAVIKMKCLRAATEIAVSVLRIDEMIVLNEEKKEKRDECH